MANYLAIACTRYNSKNMHYFDDSGSGTPLWSADNGSSYTNGVCTDGSGNAFFGHNRASSITTRKYNSSGTQQWTADHGAHVYSIVCDGSGNLYTAGDYYISGSIRYNVRRYSSSGSLQWSADFGNPANISEHPAALDIHLDASGNVYVSGYHPGGTNVKKYNSSGTLQWSRSYVSTSTSISRLVVLAEDTIAIIEGRNLRKYDSSGTQVWSVAVGVSGDYLNDLAADSSGNLYVCGRRGGTKTSYKYNSSGSLVWDADHGAECYGITVDSSGNVYTVGVLSSGKGLRKYSPSGTLLYSSALPIGTGTSQYGSRIAIYQTQEAVPGLPLGIALGVPVCGFSALPPGVGVAIALGVPTLGIPNPPDAQMLRRPFRQAYHLYLARAGDLVEVPLASVQCRRSRGSGTWMAAMIPAYTPALWAAVQAQIGGAVVILAGYDDGSGEALSPFLDGRVTDISLDCDARAASIRLTARVAAPYRAPQSRALVQVRARGESSGGRRVATCAIDPLLHPGDAVDDGARPPWTAGTIEYQIGPSVAEMRVEEGD